MKVRLNFHVVLVSTLCACLIFKAELSQAADPERTVAEVDGVPISERQLDQFIDTVFLNLNQPSDAQELRELRKNALQRLIDRELLFRAAPPLPADEIKQAMEESLQSLGSGANARNPNPHLLTRASTESFKAELLKDITIQRFLENRAAPVRATSLAEDTQPNSPLEYRLRQILIKKPPASEARDSSLSRDKAEKIRSEIGDSPERFAELARRHSAGPARSRGGELGFITLNQLTPNLAQAVELLKVGELTPIIEDEHGFHLLLLDETRQKSPAKTASRSSPSQVNKQRERNLATETSLLLLQLRKQSKLILYLD